jgi:hypothetical protein
MALTRFSRIRFKISRPASIPPRGHVDVFWDVTEQALVSIDNDGVKNVFALSREDVESIINETSPEPIAVEATEAYELPIPSGTPQPGAKAKFYITASGADRDLTLATGIRVPSDSAITFPKTLTSGETYIVQLEYLGSFWMLTTIVGGGV